MSLIGVYKILKGEEKMKKTIVAGLMLSGALFGGDFTNSIGMKFVQIPDGTFKMGKQIQDCPKDDPYTKVNEYEVCVGEIKKGELLAYSAPVKSFYMQTTEVTQGQWFEVMGYNPAKFQTGDMNMPIEQVSFGEARKFIKQLNQKENTNKYDFPTEVQWEYASNVGNAIKLAPPQSCERCADTITLHNVKNTYPVAKKEPNAWGLYDMNGNVWEWTKDCYQNAPNRDDLKCTSCCWVDLAEDKNSIFRFNYSSEHRYFSVGFRLVVNE